MGRGRPPKPGTTEEKAAARRKRVRNNVRALRERRRKEAAHVEEVVGTNRLTVEWKEEALCELSTSRQLATCPHDTESGKGLDSTNASTSSSASRSGALFLVNRSTDARVIFPTNVDSKSSYATALLATVREQFLPDAVYLPPAISSTNGKPWESEQFLWTPCAFWVTSAFTKASNQETGLLKTSLLAIGMLMKSLQFQDNCLKSASLEMYRRCLQGIRKSVEPLLKDRLERPKDTVALYLSCHAAAMFELVHNSDLSATMHHLRGISQLICHLGDGRDEDSHAVGWLLIQDYRFAEMGLCLKFRYASVMSLRRRQFEQSTLGTLNFSRRDPSAHGYGSHNMLVKITDMADDISFVMVQLDALRLHRGRIDTSLKLRRMLERLEAVWAGYQHLHDQLTSRYGSGFIYKVTSHDSQASASVKFKNFDIGAAWCYNLMTQTYCIETMIDVTTTSLEVKRGSSFAQLWTEDEGSSVSDGAEISYARLHELRGLLRSICVQLIQCLLYFLQTDKGVTGQTLALFPLDASASMIDIELGRLQADLNELQTLQNNTMRAHTVQANMNELLDAGAFCRKMQERARAFGLPAFYTAGPGTADDVLASETFNKMAPKG
ncbi:hypothetical protein LTR70_000808 [Exophiala xenobiotica]|uniref:BZIP domain-containing protein n=1 Tax=Lithohypha guttulata TaxID=1690604 RepID=A0ABR0KN38_9EURO|nr:hypothetical protein LTR24_000519 [Lithohypha guttulata]KAK5329311.1 hypothetical protein LTR70_000808 [Exophiala xenobiotica]